MLLEFRIAHHTEWVRGLAPDDFPHRDSRPHRHRALHRHDLVAIHRPRELLGDGDHVLQVR